MELGAALPKPLNEVKVIRWVGIEQVFRFLQFFKIRIPMNFAKRKEPGLNHIVDGKNVGYLLIGPGLRTYPLGSEHIKLPHSCSDGVSCREFERIPLVSNLHQAPSSVQSAEGTAGTSVQPE